MASFMMCANSLGSELSIQNSTHNAPNEFCMTPDDASCCSHCSIERDPVGTRSWLQHLPPSLILPQKRSIRSSIPRHNYDGQHLLSRHACEDGSSSSSSLSTTFSSSESGEGETESHEEIATPSTKLSTRNNTLAIDCSKALLSPIRFSPQSEGNGCQLSATEPDPISTPAPPKHSDKPSRYIFYSPKNPSEKRSEKLFHVLDPQRKVPRRQLSYGEPLSTPKPRSLHKTTALPELRHKAGWEPDDEHDSWFDGALKASAVRPWYSEPTRTKPRLWLDLAEGEKIQEAVSNPKDPSERRLIQKCELMILQASSYSDFESLKATANLYPPPPSYPHLFPSGVSSQP